MKFLIKRMALVLIFIFISIGFSQVVSADSNNFSVTPVLPENQALDNPSYFDLTVTPNQKQILQIKIKNNSDESVKYKVYVNTATTNQNGIIDYSMSDFEKDESMKLSVEDCVKLSEPQIEVPAESEKEVSIELSIPETPFEGVALGGITIEPIVEETQGVSSIFTRTLAIQLRESDEEVFPQLESGNVLISQENLRNNIQFELRNITPTVISGVNAEITVTKKGAKEPVFEQQKEKLNFAPNSKFSLLSQWNDQFKSGEYVYKISLIDGKGNTWDFHKEFEVKAKEAKKLNETSVDKKKISIKDKDYLVYIEIAVIVVIALVIWMILKKIKVNSDSLK
ncbi:DUF916 and DUF3324 domain-containing protein [Enterococcus faecalis]|uniref:DUF916 and DUF3324 domain-containing protein n=1 Tax=Enterococcus faecalis TaxID=1351 RepID=UPI000CF6D528|nr:DUF916 and DUF3324 domain-containing protein [Enterococcus faecalis]EGO5243391.1 DUF916 and DUF3324 domain-containing protein [Enterococcus faecalis]EHK9982037.1 DUF916 and DUF3324 domain-containing protein [Enterococcus faecalis]PQC14067.1 hypothetical protein CUM91_07500 [Enterococcus faecalis]